MEITIVATGFNVTEGPELQQQTPTGPEQVASKKLTIIGACGNSAAVVIDDTSWAEHFLPFLNDPVAYQAKLETDRQAQEARARIVRP